MTSDSSSDGGRAINDTKLDRLIESNVELVASNDRMATASEELAVATVEYQERALTARRRFRTTMIAIGGVALLFMGGIVVELYSAGKSRDQIRDCIIQTGKCYQESQQRTGDAIGSIGTIIDIAVACEGDYVKLPREQRIAAIKACVARELKKHPLSIPTPSTPRPSSPSPVPSSSTSSSSVPGALPGPVLPTHFPITIVTIHPPPATRTTTQTRVATVPASPPASSPPPGGVLLPVCKTLSSLGLPGLPILCVPAS